MDTLEDRIIDYNYETSPDFIEHIVEQAGGLSVLLHTAQLHHIEITFGADLQYYCWIGHGESRACWDVSLDSFTAMVLGIHKFNQYNKPNKPNADQLSPAQAEEQRRKESETETDSQLPWDADSPA